MLQVVHVSPTYFAPESILGGGERFAEELARSMSSQARVRFVSFGPRSARSGEGGSFERHILRNWTARKLIPFSPSLPALLRDADVIHCHQVNYLSTFLSAWLGARRGAKVFVSDLGGGGWTPAYHVDQSRWITGYLFISEYARTKLPTEGPARVIYAGVDTERWSMRDQPTHDGSVVFLGRILSHKGIHHLVEGLPDDVILTVIGSEADPQYLDELRALARGKTVHFRSGLDDEAVRRHLHAAMALVHPTPVDARGDAGVAELFGLAVAEAMACGCPVVASNAASLPEVVGSGAAGILVPPNSPEAIRAAIRTLADDRQVWAARSRAARARVEELFTWPKVVRRCLEAYAELGAEHAINRSRGSRTTGAAGTSAGGSQP
ncbi:MAG TPA: glycosyltransferase family 4 protein [Thermoanaerobaculia bacterium]|nr:glycosyltransferase family 4 protein [Thermoanaerobaculia bacterium]